MGSGPLLVPMHLGLNNRPFVPHAKLWEPCYFTKVPELWGKLTVLARNITQIPLSFILLPNHYMG